MWYGLLTQIMNGILLILLSVIGWKAFELIKCPSPKVLGALAFVMAANLLGLNLSVPGAMNTALTIGLGIIVGLQFNLNLGARLIWKVVLACAWMILSGILIGKIISRLGVGADTAFFSCLPGGMTEMTFLSVAFDVDSFQVTLFHATRMVALLVVMPFIIRRFFPANSVPAKKEAAAGQTEKAVRALDWPLTALLAIGSGLLLNALNVPLGSFVGPIVTTALYIKVRKIRLAMNNIPRSIFECTIGGVVGTKVTLASILLLPTLIVPLLSAILLIIGSSLLLGWCLYKIGGIDRMTAQLAVIPGGSSPVIVMAAQMNADVSIVAVFQLCRYLSMVFFALVYGLVIM